MGTTSDKKRKADATDAADRSAKKSAVAKQTPNAASDASDPELSGESIPAPVCGHVMDYLPYTDVLKCLMVNRLLSFEAP